MSFFTAIEKLRALPEEKRVNLVFSFAGVCTGFIFLLWAMFIFLDNTYTPSGTIAEHTSSSTVSTAPSPADLLVAGIKAHNDELLDQTQGLRALLGDDEDARSGAFPSSMGTERIGDETTLGVSRVPVNSDGMTAAEKEALLDAYFQETEAQKQTQTQVYPEQY